MHWQKGNNSLNQCFSLKEIPKKKKHIYYFPSSILSAAAQLYLKNFFITRSKQANIFYIIKLINKELRKTFYREINFYYSSKVFSLKKM